MLVRWSVAGLLAASVFISTLELSACVVSRAATARSAPAASVEHDVAARDVDLGVPTAPEIEGPAPSTSPELTY